MRISEQPPHRLIGTLEDAICVQSTDVSDRQRDVEWRMKIYDAGAMLKLVPGRSRYDCARRSQ